jgi:hypothetical protein
LLHSALEGEGETELKMYKKRFGPQLLYYKECSKMQGLPCRCLASSIRGCNMENAPRKTRIGRIKKVISHIPIVGYALQLLFCRISAQFGQEEIFFKHTRKPFPNHNLQLFLVSLKLVQWYGFL